MLTVLEEGVDESREGYLERVLISNNIETHISKYVSHGKKKLEQAIAYLSLELPELLKPHQFLPKIQELGGEMSFKNFTEISLAQGWLITTYIPCVAYLTFDHFLVVFDLSGSLLKKI
jgi:hypothetical protein